MRLIISLLVTNQIKLLMSVVLLRFFTTMSSFAVIKLSVGRDPSTDLCTTEVIKIARFFPHEIADLSIALNYMSNPDDLVKDPEQWPLRYVMLLWLSLICMLPFDLSQFDERNKPGHTASQIESVAKTYINKAGIERDGAAILLARLYLR